MVIAALLIAALALSAAGCAPPPPRSGLPPSSAPLPAHGGSLEAVLRRTFTAYGFTLENGTKLPEMTLAFETYGRLGRDGRNAVLITHGFTSSHHAAGRHAPGDPTAGWWDALIGPGKAIDTNRYFVVSSNMLGSSYGSTAPGSVNLATGRPYGPDFPTITVGDIVAAQRLLLDALGVTHLVAVAGPSFGGYQAFQWAVRYPTFMDAVVPVATAPKGSGGDQAVRSLLRRLAADPNWNGGWYYDRGGVAATLTALRIETLRRYGIEEVLAATVPDGAARADRLRSMAEAWARQFDANSLVALRRASVRFDAERDLPRIRARVLYVLSRTDKLFPPSIAPAIMEKLAAAGVDARYVEIDSDFGHSASGADAAKWAPALRAFLAGLPR